MRLFYSYSSKDEELRLELEDHLSLLVRQNVLETWSFRSIEPGGKWAAEIDRHLESSDIVLLLVTASFIASDYCMDIEVRRSIELADAGALVLVPVILKPCDWQTAPFSRFQALPDGAMPVTTWLSRDLAWANVAAGIRRVVEHRLNTEASVRPTVPHDSSGALSLAVRLHRETDRRLRTIRGAESFVQQERPNLFASLRHLVETTATAAPTLGLVMKTGDAWCNVSTSDARIVVQIEGSWLSVTALFREYRPNGLFLLWDRWVWEPTAWDHWDPQLSDTDTWQWVSSAGTLSSVQELSAHLLQQVLAIHADKIAGKPLKKIKLYSSPMVFTK